MARIAVLMSGGIDSSGAAAVLKDAGHDVTGITALMSPAGVSGGEDVYRARRACHRLDISHIVLDLTDDFALYVLGPFIEAYLEGMTPNPCAHCNREIKLGRLLHVALRCGFERVATGHYARLKRDGDTLLLCEPTDSRKSQTYFLALVRPAFLDSLELPLAEMRKDEVRNLVGSLGLGARDGESQDLCFVASGAYHGLVGEHSGIAKGDVVDTNGRIIGTHKGHYAYTVGQRFGHEGKRYYVLSKDASSNRIVIGDRSMAMRQRITVRAVNNFVPLSDLKNRSLRIKYRYKTAPVGGRMAGGDACRMVFVTDEPCFAPAPGQILACYSGGYLVCGGIIESAD
jgi:tRNA-specific 2-thiouridylase